MLGFDFLISTRPDDFYGNDQILLQVDFAAL
jgi:hypothetical protein